MILLDTNVLIYAADRGSRYFTWARETVADAVSDEGAAVNAVSLAEICVGDLEPETVAERIRSWGVDILDVPAAAASVCATAYRESRSPARNPPTFPSLTFSSAPMLRSWAGLWRQPT